eukprot:COSAG02_NODE_13633_length_1369_cov_1.414961_1_plen_107_part_00
MCCCALAGTQKMNLTASARISHGKIESGPIAALFPVNTCEQCCEHGAPKPLEREGWLQWEGLPTRYRIPPANSMGARPCRPLLYPLRSILCKLSVGENRAITLPTQ